MDARETAATIMRESVGNSDLARRLAHIRDTESAGFFDAVCAAALELTECQYSPRHRAEGIAAVTVIDCGLVGKVPACQACADFYARMS